MKFASVFLFFLLIFSSARASDCVPAVGAKKFANNCKASVSLQIHTSPMSEEMVGFGSGVVVSKNEGFVITAAHVISKNESAVSIVVVRYAVNGAARFVLANLVSVDHERDIALLVADTEFEAEAKLGSTAKLRPGSRVYGISTLFGEEHRSITKGYFIGKTAHPLFPELNALYLGVDVSPGSSGGGLYDSNGRLVGLFSAYNLGTRFTFGVPVEEIKKMLEARACLPPTSCPKKLKK